MTRTHLRASTFSIAVILIVMNPAASKIVNAQTKDTVVAIVNKRNITQAELDESIFSQLFALEEQIHALRKVALENLISRKLLENEAARRGLSVNELKRQLTAGVVDVPPARVDEVYLENAAAFGNMSADEAKERLRLDLESQARMQKYRTALAKLKEAAQIELFLEEPRLRAINTQRAPSIGSEKARVTIIEFSDFQCPFCRNSQTALREILKSYKNDVKLIFKHRPLEIHSLAFLAAQAAFCAGEQTAFWPYHDALFVTEDLSADFFRKLAAELNLDRARFNLCLTSTASQQAVQADASEAQRLGINSTPTFVINGKVVRGVLTVDEFKAAVEKELQSDRRLTPQ